MSTHAALYDNSSHKNTKQNKLINTLDNNKMINFVTNCLILANCSGEFSTPDIDLSFVSLITDAPFILLIPVGSRE